MSNTLSAPLQAIRFIAFFFSLLLVLGAASTRVRAQSTDIERPSPVTNNEISGSITARDIGDSRQTRHFFILTGTPGDLVFTVESRNLDGDIDLFQAGTLRPLAKVSMYSGELASSTSKSIYLRQRETIILRVEARTPNDREGSYRVRFSGGFEAMAAPTPNETEAVAETQPTTPRRDRNTQRVNSVGARIDEPVETAKGGEPDSQTAESTQPATDDSAKPATDNTTTTPEPVTTARRPAPPNTRGRRRRGRVTPQKPPETASSQDNTTSPADPGEPPATVAPAEAGPKLIIETRDGMRIERYMTSVRRVTVERGQIVVVTNDGKITRHPMTNVLRMSIEP